MGSRNEDGERDRLEHHQKEWPVGAEASSYLCGSRQDLGEHLLTLARPQRGQTCGGKGLELEVGRMKKLTGPD